MSNHQTVPVTPPTTPLSTLPPLTQTTVHPQFRLSRDNTRLYGPDGKTFSVPGRLTLETVNDLLGYAFYTSPYGTTTGPQVGLVRLDMALSSERQALTTVHLRAQGYRWLERIGRYMNTTQGQVLQARIAEAVRIDDLRASAVTPADRAGVTRALKVYQANLEQGGVDAQTVTFYQRTWSLTSPLVMAVRRQRDHREVYTQERQQRIQAGRAVYRAWAETPHAQALKAEWKQAQRSLQRLAEEDALWSILPGYLWKEQFSRYEELNRQYRRFADHAQKRGTNPHLTDERWERHVRRHRRRENLLRTLNRSCAEQSRALENRERLRLRRLGVPVPDRTELFTLTRPDRLARATAKLQVYAYGVRWNQTAAEKRREQLIHAIQNFHRAVEKAAKFKGKAVRARHLAAALAAAQAEPLLAPKLSMILRWTLKETGTDLGAAPHWQPPVRPEPVPTPPMLQPSLF